MTASEEWAIVVKAAEKARKTFYKNLNGMDGAYFPLFIAVHDYNVEWERYGNRTYVINDFPEEKKEDEE